MALPYKCDICVNNIFERLYFSESDSVSINYLKYCFGANRFHENNFLRF